MGLELSDDDETHRKPVAEAKSHPPGTVVAPMAGLVIKLMVKNGEKVEEGQSVLVLEAMKMEVCTSDKEFPFALYLYALVDCFLLFKVF